LISAYEADEGAPEFDEAHHHHTSTTPGRGWLERLNTAFNRRFHSMLDIYDAWVRRALEHPRMVVLGIIGLFIVSLGLFPFLGVAFFPRTDAGQFEISLKAPSGSRIEVTDSDVAQVEALIRETVAPDDLKLIVSNIGVIPGFSSIYTSNSGPHTATILVALKEGHRIGSYAYMDRVRRRLAREIPELSAYFQSGGLQDAVLNQGLPAPIDVQVSGSSLEEAFHAASQIAARIRRLPGVSDVFVPQDLDYPALKLGVDRLRASELGLNQREVVDNIITALTSNGMIAPSYWIDPHTGNDYMLTVQYPEQAVHGLADLSEIPLHAPGWREPALLGAVSTITRAESPTEIDHYQIQREIDIYVNPATEDLGDVATGIDHVLSDTQLPAGVRVNLRGMVQGMRSSFRSFGLGLVLSIVLLYLILVAQFKSFVDPLLILLAVPTGITGVLIILFATGTTLNVQSLMGVIMMVGIVVSNSILIVDFAHRLEEQGMDVREAIITSCRIRLRPILMTSLATVIGLIPLALKLGTGSEAYAPLARAIVGGLTVSVALTLFLVPAAYLMAYRNKSRDTAVEAQ